MDLSFFILPKKYILIKNLDKIELIDENVFYNFQIDVTSVTNIAVNKILVIGKYNDTIIKIIHSKKIRKVIKKNQPLKISGQIKVDEEGNYFCFFPKVSHQKLGILPVYTKKPKLLSMKKYTSKLFLSLNKIHFPQSISEAEEGIKELFSYEIGFIYNILKNRKIKKTPNLNNLPFVLPFNLNSSQENAVKEIYYNLEKSETCYHFLFGDVASGKTVVGFIAALKVFANHKNVVVLTPSVLLANQIFDNYKKWTELSKLSIPIHLITNKNKTDEENGIFIGTQALLFKKINNIGLLIIDEQHKFGIEQRNVLIKESSSDILMLSATPIPRTYQMMLENFISVSVLDGKEKQQSTKIVHMKDKNLLLEKIIDFSSNNKVIWVCKTIKDQMELLEQIKHVKNLFLINSKIKDKEFILKDFNNSKGSILLSTTVIEVGIDIQVNTIVIDKADSFGVSQLHQLRGRVGRQANQKSICILLGEDIEKLEKFSEKKNNIELSDLDLENRGSGSLFEKSQSGFKSFKFSKHINNKLLLVDKNISVTPYLLENEDLEIFKSVIDYDFTSLLY